MRSPDKSLEHVDDQEGGLHHHEQEGEVDPRELACNSQHERMHPMWS